MMAVAVPVFRNQYLENTSGGGMITSEAIPLQGNRACLCVTVYNSSSGTGTMTVQGSYDGIAWANLTNPVTIPTFGAANDGGNGNLQYAFLRVLVNITGASGKILFDATLVMSAQ